MDGFQDDADSLRGSGGRMILKMGFRTLTSPKRSADRDKNEPSRFLGDGVSFRAKLIGILEVGEARGERMCQEALADLKMAVRAAGEHKQRIVVCVAIDGLRLRDDKTGDCLYHHPVHKISFIAQDMTDSRAFGYIFGSPDTGHRFFGIKTDKAASQVVIAMRDLFQVVFELKKKEIEMAKQHIEQQQLKYSSSGASKLADNSSKESGDQGKMRPIAEDQPENGGGGGGGRGSGGHRRHAAASAAVVAISPPPRHPNALHHQQQQQTSEVIADLLDLEIELSSIQAGIHQMEKMTPSDPFGPGATTPSAITSLHPPTLPSAPDTTLSPTVSVEDPFGDSFVGPPNVPTALPPPPSTAATPSLPVTSSSLSIQGCKVQRQGLNASVPLKGTSGGIAESTWFERPLGSEDLFGEVLPQGGEIEAGREQEKGNRNGVASQTSIGAGDFNSGKSLAGVIGDDVKGAANSSAGNASQFDVFTELDPLGTGRSRPYVDKKDFFQELKNPPKKVLRDLVGGVDASVAHSSAASASAAAPALSSAIGAPSAPPVAAFCSSSAPLFHAMFDAGDVSQTASDLFSSSDLFFPPPGAAALSLGPVVSAAPKGPPRNVDGVFPACGRSAAGDAAPSPLVSSHAATDAGALATADDPFADTDPFADEGSAPVTASLSDLDVAGIFPRIEDDPFDTGFADFTTLAGGPSSRRKRLDHESCASATLGRRPRSSKGISHGPLRVSLPPEKGASKALESPVLLPPPPSGGDVLSLTAGTIPRSRSRSPRIPRQSSAGGSRVPSPKSGVQRHRAVGAPVVARTSSEGAYSSSPQSPPEPPPRPPSSGGAKPPPLPPKRVTVGPSATPLAPLGIPFPDEDDEDDASQYEFINQYETSRPAALSPSRIEAKSVAGAKKADVGLPPPPRRQHQRASPSGEQSSSSETAKKAHRATAHATQPAASGVRSEPPQGGVTEAAAPTFDLTLAELGRMSIVDLASALCIPPERVSTMTLQELAEMLSASRAKMSKSPDKTRETCKDEERIKRDRYAALRESLDDESVANTTNFNADFDAKFDNDFAKEEGPKILDDVFREAPFDKYAVFRELIESEADGNEKTEEINDQTVPTEEETGSVEAVDEGRDASPANDASASDASKEGDACSRESQPGEQTDDKESASVAGKEEEEEESSREETEDKYAALREICLMEDKEEERTGAPEAAETNSSEEKKGPPAAEEESAAEREAVDLLVLSRRASEAPEEEGNKREDTRVREARGGEQKGSERENAGWANFEAEATEKATDGGDSEEAVSPWSSEGREVVGWGVGDGAWGNEARTESSTRIQSKAAEGARGEGKRASGAYRACRWKERRACTAEEDDEEDEDEEERRGRRGRSRRSRRAVSPWGREEEEAPRRRCWEEPPEEAWARRAAGRGSCWDGPPPPRRARPPPSRTRKPSTWGDEEDEGEEDGEWVQQRREGEEGGERWRARKRRGRRRTGSVEWDAEGEDEGEEEVEEERGRWRGQRRQGGPSWGEEEEVGGWGGAWGAARQRGPARSRSYRSWDEEDEAEEDYREGEGRWAAEEEEEGGERRRRRARTASGESSASIRSAALYPRHLRYEQDEAPPIAGRGRGRESAVASRRRTAPPSGPPGQRKSAARWQQQQWREEEEEGGEGRWGRRVTTGSTIQPSRGGGSRRGRQRGKDTAGGGKVVRAPSRGSSGGRLQSPFEDDFVHAAGGGGSSVSSDVSESRRSPVAPPTHNGRCSDDVFLPCEGEIADGTAFPFPAKSGRAVDACSSAQRPFSAPVDGARHQAERFHGPRDRVSGTIPSSRSAHRAQRQSAMELGNGSIRKSESVNIFARDSDPFDDDFFSSGGGSTCAEKGKTGCGSRQLSSAVSDPFKWTEPFDHFEFREEEEEEDDEEDEEEEEDATGCRERCRERKGTTAAEGTN